MPNIIRLVALTGVFIALSSPPEARSQAAPAGWCTHSGAQRLNADINGDGRTDALCHDRNTGSKWIALNDGTSLIQRWVDPSNGWCIHAGAALFLGDVNGDGRADLVCKDPDRIWIDHGAADYFRGTDFFVDTKWCTHPGAVVSLSDMNADRRTDLVCTSPDGTMHVDFADDVGRFAGTDFFGTCATSSRTSFVPAESTASSSATAAGLLRVQSSSVAAESKTSSTFVETSGFSGSATTASSVTVAAPTVISGHYSFAGAPAGSWLQAGAALRLSVLDSAGRELCADEQLLGSGEFAGLSASTPLNRITRPMSCSIRHAGAFTARTTLRGWTTAVWFGSANVHADVQVPLMTLRTCSAR